MLKMFDKIFGKRRADKKEQRNTTASAGLLNKMPENVNYGEDSGAVSPEELDKLQDQILTNQCFADCHD